MLSGVEPRALGRLRANGGHLGFWVYMLRCADDSFYVGHTDDLELRLAQHHGGFFGGYTSTRRPVTLVFAQEFPTRDDAIGREHQLKGWSRVKKRALVAADFWAGLSRSARGTDRQ